MANGMAAYEEAVMPFKYKLLQEAFSSTGAQKILEVGIGAGPNLPFLASLVGDQVLHACMLLKTQPQYRI